MIMELVLSMRFQAFNDAFTEINNEKGCKGVGRYTILACMGSMEVNSTFYEDNKWENRIFKFHSVNGVIPENNEKLKITGENKPLTIVKLNNYQKIPDFL